MHFESDNETIASAQQAEMPTRRGAVSSNTDSYPMRDEQTESELIQIGEQLTAARKSKLLTLDTAANELNIFARHLSRLEAGEQLDIPELYAKGYLKVYCRYLGLNADQMVERYIRAIQPVAVIAEPEESSVFVPESSWVLFARSIQASVTDGVNFVSRSARSGLSVAVPAFLLAVVGFAYYSVDVERNATDEVLLSGIQTQQPDKLGVLASEAVSTKSKPLIASNQVLVDTASAESAEALNEVPLSEAPLDEVPLVNEAQPEEYLVATAVRQGNVEGLLTVGGGVELSPNGRAMVPNASFGDAFEPVGPGAVEMISQISESDRLVITVYEDSWIDVRDTTGARLYRNLARAGRRIDVSGELPFSLHVGNAPGLELRLNGEPVELEGRSDKSARLTIAAAN